MGVSTDAILFWGYCWKDEGDSIYGAEDEPAEDEDSDEWEKRYAAAHGVTEPAEAYPEKDSAPDAARIKKLHEAYWDKKRKLVERSGCAVHVHCSYDYAVPYIAVEKSRTVAKRGYPEPIADIDVADGWEEKLRDFCKALGVKPPKGQKPRWWLVSLWG
jgi:hypothetical protein